MLYHVTLLFFEFRFTFLVFRIQVMMKNVWLFATFLHRFKQILAIKIKIKQCYAIACLFLFKMSHHTYLSVKYSRRSSNFSPVQSSFESSLGKASSDEGGSATFFATFLYQVSSITELLCADLFISFAYYMTDTW